MTLPTIIWCIIPSIANACGVAIHLELVDRILPLLPRHITENYNFIRSGAFYPDAFYNCQGQYDVAEDAHWPPFLAKGVELVHKRRAQGQNTAQLEAFLVGILTHQVSDVSWHSSGLFQGLSRAIADSEFDGDYDRAHTNLDMGGDMIYLSQHANPSEKNADWDYNVDDIIALLNANGYSDVPASSIHFCMARGQAAYSVEKRTADVAFKRFARRSPLSFDELESYATGGLTDMHEQIQECLPSLFSWLNENPKNSMKTADPWKICSVFEGMTPGNRETKRSLADRAHLHVHTAHHYANDAVEVFRDVVSEIDNKISLHNKEVIRPLLRKNFILPPSRSFNSSPGLEQPNIQEQRPLFGASIRFWDQNLLVGAPGEGVVYLLDENGKFKEQINSTSLSLKLPGKWPVHFGTQIEIWNQHVVVSSPGISQLDIYNSATEWVGGIRWSEATAKYGSKGLKMVGEKLVVDESDGTLYVGAPHADVQCQNDDEWIDQAGAVYTLPKKLLHRILRKPGYVELKSHEYLLYRGTDAYDKAGASLAVTPRFILVGIPGKAQVSGFDFAKKTPILRLQDASKASLTGFGQHLLTGTLDYIVVGAPSTQDNQEGLIHIYKNNQVRTTTVPSEFSWLGQQGILVGKNKSIAASSHANGGQGLLWEVDLSAAQTKLLGAEPEGFSSDYGAAMATNGSVVAIGMPHYVSSRQNSQGRMGAVSIVSVP